MIFSHTLPIINCSQKYGVLLLFCALLSGCHFFHEQQPETLLGGQPGDYLVSKVQEAVPEQRIKQTDTAQINQILQKVYTTSVLPKSTTKHFKQYPILSAKLVQSLSQGNNLEQTIIEQATVAPKTFQNTLFLALIMYPVNSYRLIESLDESGEIPREELVNAGLIANLDPSLLFPATASQYESIKVEPLFHSTSVTLFNQSESTNTQVRYRPVGSNDWKDALDLQWEPIRGALSGSIVHLESDTAYELNINVVNSDESIETIEHVFQTRKESPPINPELVFQLSDIYSGGQLDLEALNIEGSEDGWAKIVGDPNIVITPNEEDLSAIYIGAQSYIMFENITTQGGARYGIHALKAHHLWIKGCDISSYGHVATDFRNGIGYLSTESTGSINYESGIYLERSGVVVIEECTIHSPNGQANNWGSGHPKGPNALQVWANHPIDDYKGQYIVRNNKFYGTPEKRFNDVIEGRGNTSNTGGFVRDSAIYNNYLAYANDDLIEIDGGQSNVLVYNNEITQGYAGISAAPNMIGPSYIFNNYIHDLGDDRGREWTAIKMGGLISKPAGITNLFENLIVTNRNGVSGSSVQGDNTFWLNAQNNIIITRNDANAVGLGIYDQAFYEGSLFTNNLIFNEKLGSAKVQAIENGNFYYLRSNNAERVDEIEKSSNAFAALPIEESFLIPNFSQLPEGGLASAQNDTDNINFDQADISSFDTQDTFGTYAISENGESISISGNSWKKIEFPYEVKASSYLTLELSNIEGAPEIIGIAVENNNKASEERSFNLVGSQNWGITDFKSTSSNTYTIPIGQYVSGEISHVVLIVDDDKNESSSVMFENLSLYEKLSGTNTSEKELDVVVGISN